MWWIWHGSYPRRNSIYCFCDIFVQSAPARRQEPSQNRTTKAASCMPLPATTMIRTDQNLSDQTSRPTRSTQIFSTLLKWRLINIPKRIARMTSQCHCACQWQGKTFLFLLHSRRWHLLPHTLINPHCQLSTTARENTLLLPLFPLQQHIAESRIASLSQCRSNKYSRRRDAECQFFDLWWESSIATLLPSHYCLLILPRWHLWRHQSSVLARGAGIDGILHPACLRDKSNTTNRD